MKIKMSLFILSVITVGAYLFWTDFGLIKKLVGYNAPTVTDPETLSSKPDNKDDGLGFLNIPDGFRISVVADGLENPRVILFDPNGRMIVSETKIGRVSILEGPEFENKRVLIDGLKSPHGLDFYKDLKTGITYLYIAETHQVARYQYDVSEGKLITTAGVNIANLPEGGRHFTRTIAFGPNFRTKQIAQGINSINTLGEDKLYISVGSSCDVCEESTWKRAAILESDPEGTYAAEFAGGLRNSVFFTFHPITKEIWATEMGRDNLGDNLPPDEINIVKVAGPEHKFGARRYGWPFCYGDKVQDKKFNPDNWERIDVTNDCSQTESSIIEIPAHSAPLGLAFVPDSWGSFSGDLLVAYHGSWNRSVPTGYKIVRYDLDKNGSVLSQESVDFVSGWLSQDKKNVYGRPVDLKFGPDGVLYISDDAAGIIYKLEPK